MADPAKTLLAQYALPHRYATFGPAIRQIRIAGFRGIDDLTLPFEAPICAVSGLNGAGKSTIGQLAICGYRKPTTGGSNYKRYYVKDFFPASVADPDPFTAQARIEFTYETNQAAAPQMVTISRANKEWSGYKRQPEGYCFYVGFTLYIPKVERRDLSVYRGSVADLRAKRAIAADSRAKVAEILKISYDDLSFQTIGHGTKEVELGMASRGGKQYSENNMGFGEGRVLYMVDLLENVPVQSLFVLEEPETSLHEDAQFRLARYLIDVCCRRHHQIILSTHSSVILDALPEACRTLVVRHAGQVTQYPGISSTRARALLSGGHQKALNICVEDHFAKLVLTELVRRGDPTLLKAIHISPLGGKGAVLNGVRLLDQLKLKAIGVRDGDVPPSPADRMWSLPGTTPPENEVFSSPAVAALLQDAYELDIAHFRATTTVADIHELPGLLATELSLTTDVLSGLAISTYVKALPEAVVTESLVPIAANV